MRKSNTASASSTDKQRLIALSKALIAECSSSKTISDLAYEVHIKVEQPKALRGAAAAPPIEPKSYNITLFFRTK